MASSAVLHPALVDHVQTRQKPGRRRCAWLPAQGSGRSRPNRRRRITEATNGRALTFAYDAAGNPRTMTWPDGGQMTYAFDAANRLTSLAAAGVSVGPGYDGLSRVTSITRAASSSTVGFDNADRMTSLAHVFTPTTGNQAWGFAFTPASQLSAATSTNPAYDWTTSAATTVNTTTDGLNRDAGIAAMGAPCAATNAGYDCNGNLTYDGTRRFTYDAENRLTGETGPVTMSLAYDPTGRLQQTIVNGATTQFLYDGDALVAEYDGSNNILRRYIHGPGADNPVIWFEGSALTTANAAYLIADRQGSIVATANTAGAVTANLTYDAYGVPNAWGGSRFRYTSQIELPEAGLYYYKARVYDPASGRFLQTDPVGYADNVNWYAYTGNDPVNGADPSGTCGSGVGNTPAAALRAWRGCRDRPPTQAGSIPHRASGFLPSRPKMDRAQQTGLAPIRRLYRPAKAAVALPPRTRIAP